MRIDRCALYVLIKGIVLMARLNITLPDVLYARLEQLRDRINLSKVCATALEKEVTMLEGQPNITDPRIAQLLSGFRVPVNAGISAATRMASGGPWTWPLVTNCRAWQSISQNRT